MVRTSKIEDSLLDVIPDTRKVMRKITLNGCICQEKPIISTRPFCVVLFQTYSTGFGSITDLNNHNSLCNGWIRDERRPIHQTSLNQYLISSRLLGTAALSTHLTAGPKPWFLKRLLSGSFNNNNSSNRGKRGLLERQKPLGPGLSPPKPIPSRVVGGMRATLSSPMNK